MTATADVYTESLIALESRAEELRAELDEAKEAEQSAIRAHIKATPKVRPFSDLASEPAKLRRKIVKLTKELASVEAELPLMHQAAADAQREQVQSDLVRYEIEVRAVEAGIPQVWEKMTEAFAELIRLWVSESGRITRERQRINEAARAACDSHGASREKWEQIYQSQQVHPLPSTFVSALRKMEMDATIDRELAEVLRNRPEAWVSTGIGFTGEVQMSYSRFYATWHDYPNATTPVVAAFLQALEDFLVTVSSGIAPPSSPSTNDALVYNGSAWTNAKIVNANVDPAAAIAYSKLALAASVVNGDISASAAIAYSKLNLAASVTNADIANAAAIAYSKLNLAGSVTNADIATSAAVAISKLADPGSGNVITSAGAGAIAAKPPGYEFDHAALTTDLNVTGTTTGSPTTVVTGSSVTYDGSTSIWIDFSCYAMSKGTSKTNIGAYEDGSYLKDIVDYLHTTTGPAYGRLRRTPTAGQHTYSIRAYVDAGTGIIFATGEAPAEMSVRKI